MPVTCLLPAGSAFVGLQNPRQVIVVTETGTPAPTGFAASAGLESVDLSWDSQDAYFEIRYSTSSDFGTATLLTSNLDAYAYKHGGQPGEKYYYWLRATDGSGNSAFVGPVGGRGYVTVGNAGSANLTTPTGSWILSTLFFRTGGNLPGSCFVSFDGDNKLAASVGDGTWNDEIGGEPDYDPPISGSFTFSNLSGGAVTFWDTDPV